MTELAWNSVGAAEEAPVGFLRRVEVEGAAVCLGQTADGWVAFQDTCTHEDCSLSDGELDGGVIVCPCHASEFDLRTGDVLCPPALEPLPIFEARVEAGELQVRLGAAARRRRGGARAGGSRPDRRRPRGDRRPAPSVDGLVARRRRPHRPRRLGAGRAVRVADAAAPRGAAASGSRRRTAAASGCSPATTTSSRCRRTGRRTRPRWAGRRCEDLTPEEVEARKSMLDTDPPAHTRLRALVNKGFTPRVVNTYEERIRGLARGILAQAFERGRVRLGRGRRLGDPDVGLLRDHGPARRGPAADHRARRQAPRQHRPRGRRRGEPARADAQPIRRSACCRSRARSRSS